jgi:predicted lysophospholipase L1 biosynthesis ABC-type transport system permease subunit
MSSILVVIGRWGGILTLIVLLIALVKQLIAFIGFLMFAIKVGIVLAFIALFLLIIIAIFRGRSQRRRDLEDI